MKISTRSALAAVAVGSAIFGAAAVAAPANADVPTAVVASSSPDTFVSLSKVQLWGKGLGHDGQVQALATVKCDGGEAYHLSLQLYRFGGHNALAVSSGTCTGENSQWVFFHSEEPWAAGPANLQSVLAIGDETHGAVFRFSDGVEIS